MKKVTKEQFFEIVYKGLDVQPTIVSGPYPYTYEWRFKDGRIFGRAVDEYENGVIGKVVSTYFIN
jgi:hypothetical protein